MKVHNVVARSGHAPSNDERWRRVQSTEFRFATFAPGYVGALDSARHANRTESWRERLMIRFANPGSDIGSFTRIFQVLFEELQDAQPFSLDKMSHALVLRNLATSCGYAGDQALSRSTRTDRSRDPLYNQSKMYSELYRLLGWIHPTPDSRLSFVFTWLGAHVAAAGPHAKQLVRECVLGIAFPNHVVATKGEFRTRPFSTILRTIAALDGLLCRDEMILGPLSLDDDTTHAKVRAMTTSIAELRDAGPNKLDEAIAALAKKRNTQVNTLHNYTRFPLAVLEWSGWTEKIQDSMVYGRSMVFHRLTSVGHVQVDLINRSRDLRVAMLEGARPEIRRAAVQLGAVSVLARAGFDSAGLRQEETTWVNTLEKVSLLPRPSTPLIFSPFQELEPKETLEIFGAVGNVSYTSGKSARSGSSPATAGRPSAATTTVRMLKRTVALSAPDLSSGTNVGGILRKALAGGAVAEVAAEQLAGALSSSNRTEFYPAVRDLFCILGYNCSNSRAGVNYERWDALIAHASDSVPVEIKSPGEERFISVKGVRQALENKVILLSRQAFPTRRQTTSLVVGFSAPNDRAEVAELIADIYSALNITIGVIDFRSLAFLAVGALQGLEHDARALLSLKGFIEVAAA